jgi:predicted metal-dependent hydrolase
MKIDYRVRTNPRSRSVRLSVSYHSGVVVVVPSGFDTSRIPEIIVKKEEWIKRSIEKVQSAGSALEIPTRIQLQSIGQSFSVVVEQNVSRRNYLVEENNLLKLSVDLRNKRIPLKLLKKWFDQKATDILLPWLDRVSKEHGFAYNRGAVRSQRTRWGSCSTKKNINLNRSLLFLRPELVDYLILHELCHTVEMNHSKKFWELVGQHCQDYRTLDKELKSARKYVGGGLH